MAWEDQRRDEVPASDEWRPAPSRKKDTKLWCGGKVGRPHTPEIVMEKGSQSACGPSAGWWRNIHGQSWWCRHIEQCSVCKKVLRHTLPEQECPARASVAQ